MVARKTDKPSQKSHTRVKTPDAQEPATQLRRLLNDNADAAYAAFEKSLGMGTTHRPMGVRIPILRSIARRIVRNNNLSAIIDNPESLSDVTFEEVLLRAMLIGYAEMNTDERLKRLNDYLPLADDWALCDCAVSSLRFDDEDYDKVQRFASNLLATHDEFRVRFGAVVILTHLKAENRVQELLDMLATADTSGYYAMMGVAWACAELFKADNSRVSDFLAAHNLDEHTTRKALSKICDSLTTDNAWRQKIKALRKQLK